MAEKKYKLPTLQPKGSVIERGHKHLRGKEKSLAQRINELEQELMPGNIADKTYGDDVPGTLSTEKEFELIDRIRRDRYGDPMKSPTKYLRKLEEEKRRQRMINRDYHRTLDHLYDKTIDPDAVMRGRSFNTLYDQGSRADDIFDDQRDLIDSSYGGRSTLKRTSPRPKPKPRPTPLSPAPFKKGGKVKSYKKGGKVRGAGIAKRGTRKCKMR